MSREYADSKIKEALKLHSGSMALARQQVITWAQNDARLMKELARPHLDGIVAYQVERVASGRAELEKRHPEKVPEQEDNFGMDLLRAVAATQAAVFGHENTANAPKKRGASKQHIDAIHKMASNRHSKKT